MICTLDNNNSALQFEFIAFIPWQYFESTFHDLPKIGVDLAYLKSYSWFSVATSSKTIVWSLQPFGMNK